MLRSDSHVLWPWSSAWMSLDVLLGSLSPIYTPHLINLGLLGGWLQSHDPRSNCSHGNMKLLGDDLITLTCLPIIFVLSLFWFKFSVVNATIPSLHRSIFSSLKWSERLIKTFTTHIPEKLGHFKNVNNMKNTRLSNHTSQDFYSQQNIDNVTNV